MDKPIEYTIEEFKQKLANVINESELPHFIIAPILADYTRVYQSASQQETAKKISLYQDSKQKEEKENKDGESK